jgi:[acyl-carrier-protein] S-malonyltransferase
MAVELCGKLTAAHELFTRASAILGYDLLKVCAEGPAERLNATDVSQPAIFVASLAALEQLKVEQPDALDQVVATAGLSLGEYTALVFAGALNLEEGLKVVKARGEAMQAAALATPSAMAAVIGLDRPAVEELVAEVRPHGLIEIANLLCPGNIVVSGVVAAIDQLCTLAESRSIRTARLAVAGAFHTSLMKPADEKLAAILDQVHIAVPRIPVWSNVDANPHQDPAEIKSLLIRQVLSPVLWEDTMRKFLDLGVERFYEIGPGRVLAGLLKRVLRKADIHNVLA